MRFNAFLLLLVLNSCYQEPPKDLSIFKYNETSAINSLDPAFVRMTGSGSALVAYFQTKKRCELAKKRFNRNYKNYWCIASKTI